MGPINQSTRELYKRMLRKRTNELQASTVGSAAKKHKPEFASSSTVSRIAKPKSRHRNEARPARKQPRSKVIPVGGVSQEAAGRPCFNPPGRLVSDTPPKQVKPSAAVFSPLLQSPHIYPQLPPLLHSPQHSPSFSSLASSSSSSPCRENSSDDPSTPSSFLPRSPRPQVSSPSSTDSSSMVTTITNWLGARVKRVIGRFQEVASPCPRPPLQRTPVTSAPPSAPSKGSPQQLQVSRDSISIDEINFLEKSGASPVSGDVYLNVPSPQQFAHVGQSRPHCSNSGAVSDRYDWELMPGDVEICKKTDGQLWLLGRGGCGQVYRGLKDKVDDIAVKVIRLQGCVGDPRSSIAQFKQEIDMISKLRHRHILQFYGACIQPSCLFMVTELMDTDLFSALRQGARYTWGGEYGREVLMGIASGLHHLHSRRPPIVHRDIKSPNILIMNGLAKIADVGIANTMAATDMTAQRGFTIAWAAPEVILRKRANEKIDIWSFGIILWEVVTGNMPHPGQLVFPSQAPMHLRSLYMQCTSDNPSNRPTAAEIIHALKGP